MDGDWLKRMRGAWRGLERHHLTEGAVAGLGGALAIGAMEWASRVSHTPLGAIPFATSIVLVMGSPDAEPAQPRALVGGHILSTLIGIAVLAITGPHAWGAALAVGLAILAMYLTDTFHPPAGIDPLLVVSQNLAWTFLIAPVALGALLLALFAYVWHHGLRRRPWPRRWL
jgi:CBS-domain-containing membrane protein